MKHETGEFIILLMFFSGCALLLVTAMGIIVLILR